MTTPQLLYIPNWVNRTIWTGDNLDIMRGMNSETVDLIYLDPPFNSNNDYEAPIGSDGAVAAFKDTWTLDDVDEAWHGLIAEQEPGLYRIIDASEYSHGKGMKSYLIMMSVRLLEMKRLLKPTGSIYLHCDPVAGHYLKMVMDCVFGQRRFKREVIWNIAVLSGFKTKARNWIRGHDTILFYTKSPKFTWNSPRQPHDEKYLARFNKLDEEGRQYFDGRGKRRYLDEVVEAGKAVGDVWSDIMSFQQIPTSKEKVGYPTQKPLALLKRVIEASSNPGDMVLDPFAGCATACVAAESLGRQWVGIDLSPLAAQLVQRRLASELSLSSDDGGERAIERGRVTHRNDIPKRSDTGPLPSYKTHKRTLFGRQEGICAGCRVLFPFRNFTIDHIVAQSRGGTDHIDNLQLLCGACNSMKGTRTQEQFIAILRRDGLRD